MRNSIVLLLLVTLCLAPWCSQAQKIKLVSSYALHFPQVVHAGLGTTTFTPASGAVEEPMYIKLLNQEEEPVGLELIIPPVFQDSAFSIVEESSNVSDLLRLPGGIVRFSIPANTESQIAIRFRPVHNINYDTEILLYNPEGPYNQSIDLIGTGTYDYSQVEQFIVDFNANGQPQKLKDEKIMYAGTQNLSERELLDSLRTLLHTDYRPVPPNITKTVEFKNGEIVIGGTTGTKRDSRWQMTRSAVFRNVDNLKLNPWTDPPPLGYAEPLDSKINLTICPYTGSIGKLNLSENENLEPLNAIEAGENRLPKYAERCSVTSTEDESNSVFDIEHACPASWWSGGNTSSNLARSFPNYYDLHHLFPIRDDANRFGHSNFLYGDQVFDASATEERSYAGNLQSANEDNAPVAEQEWVSFRLKGDMSFINAGKEASYFLPDKRQRGVVARSLMYMVTRYGDVKLTNEKIISLYNLDDDPKNGWWELQKELMYYWNKESPVTPRDLKRNRIVQLFQQVRNPYVDYPQFAWRISVMNPNFIGRDKVYRATTVRPASDLSVTDLGEVENGDTLTYQYHIVNTGNEPLPVDSLKCIFTNEVGCQLQLVEAGDLSVATTEITHIAPGAAGILLLKLTPQITTELDAMVMGEISYNLPVEYPESVPYKATERQTIRFKLLVTSPDMCLAATPNGLEAGTTEVTINWIAPGIEPDEYVIGLTNQATRAYQQQRVSSTATQVQITNLEPGTLYRVQIDSKCGTTVETGSPFTFETSKLGGENLSALPLHTTMVASIYPNPGCDQLQVQIEVSVPEAYVAETTVRIYDSRGQRVLHQVFEEQLKPHTLQIERLEQGVYLIEVSNGDYQQRSKLLIEE